MSDQPASARRTLVGLPPRGPSSSGVSRLVKANRTPAAPPLAPAEPAAPPDPKSVTPDTTPKVSDSVSTRVPKYLTLVRREARIHEHQATELTRLSRHLNRLRTHQGSAGERITDNTLIRVAIDLLLQQEPQLSGTTEDELRTSLGLNHLPD
ncbi:MAG: hypothetical protein ACRC0L_10475 [Angustibacter sp.]